MKKLYFSVVVFLMAFFMTGCIDTEVFAYSNKEDIVMETSFCEKMARIEITDTYTKNDMKYYVFETDISGDDTFTLSEEEYDKYIGLGNDAVDCTVYKLTCHSDVFSYNYHFGLPNGKLHDDCQVLWDLVSASENIRSYGSVVFGNDYIHIYRTSGMEFNYGDCILRCTCDNDRADVTVDVEISHYSFAGDTEFAKEDIDQYKEVLNNLYLELVGLCRDAIE